MSEYNIYELEQRREVYQEQLNSVNKKITEKAFETTSTTEDIEALEKEKITVQKKFNVIDKQILEHTEKQKAKLRKMDTTPKNSSYEEESGALYKAMLRKTPIRDVVEKATHLGAIPEGDATLGGGEYLLPKTVSSRLITEPLDYNPLREIISITQATNYEEPRFTWDYDDAYDNITDKELAKELEMLSDSVVYGRNKVKVSAKVSDTVLLGTNIAIESKIKTIKGCLICMLINYEITMQVRSKICI